MVVSMLPQRCHFESLRLREGGVVSAESALEAGDSQEDVVVSRSKLGKVFRSEGPRHTPEGTSGVGHGFWLGALG